MDTIYHSSGIELTGLKNNIDKIRNELKKKQILKTDIKIQEIIKSVSGRASLDRKKRKSPDKIKIILKFVRVSKVVPDFDMTKIENLVKSFFIKSLINV